MPFRAFPEKFIDLSDIREKKHSSLTDILPEDHHTKEPNIPAWESIDSYEDVDDTTVFDYDPGAYATVYDIIKFKFVVEDFSGADNDVSVRVQGDASLNYRRRQLDGGTNTGMDSWEDVLLVFADTVGHCTCNVRGGNLSAAPGSPYPTITVSPGSYYVYNTETGDLLVSYSTVDQIRVFSAGAATGKIKVWGLNL